MRRPVEEKRSQKRRNTIYYLKVSDAQTQGPLGRLADITLQGMMLICEQPIEANRSYRCRVVLPREMYGRTTLEIDARCQWCRQGHNSDFYEAGFKFDISDAEDYELINKLIEHYAFEDW